MGTRRWKCALPSQRETRVFLENTCFVVGGDGLPGASRPDLCSAYFQHTL